MVAAEAAVGGVEERGSGAALRLERVVRDGGWKEGSGMTYRVL